MNTEMIAAAITAKIDYYAGFMDANGQWDQVARCVADDFADEGVSSELIGMLVGIEQEKDAINPRPRYKYIPRDEHPFSGGSGGSPTKDGPLPHGNGYHGHWHR